MHVRGNNIENPIGGESELRLICLDPMKMIISKGSHKPTIGAKVTAGRREFYKIWPGFNTARNARSSASLTPTVTRISFFGS